MKYFTIAELCKSTTADRGQRTGPVTHMVGKAYNSKQWLSLSGT